ncbi:MAG: hypothetical protein WAQ52_11545 [Terriglobales bacterium]
MLLAAVISGTGCDHEDRLAKLEKQNQELQAEIKKRDNAAGDLQSQARCSKDAKTWFKENWPSGGNTLMVDYSNHYNKARNQCFAFVEYHFAVGTEGSWLNSITLWNLYENEKVGEFIERHTIYKGDVLPPEQHMVTCTVYGTTCKGIDEFNRLSGTYMRD